MVFGFAIHYDLDIVQRLQFIILKLLFFTCRFIFLKKIPDKKVKTDRT